MGGLPGLAPPPRPNVRSNSSTNSHFTRILSHYSSQIVARNNTAAGPACSAVTCNHSSAEGFKFSACRLTLAASSNRRPVLFRATNVELYRTRILHAFYRIFKVPFVELLHPSVKISQRCPCCPTIKINNSNSINL